MYVSCGLPGNVVAGFIEVPDVRDWFTCGGNNGTVGTPEIKSTAFETFQLIKNEQTISTVSSFLPSRSRSGLPSVRLHQSAGLQLHHPQLIHLLCPSALRKKGC